MNNGGDPKPATAARIYDYFLGGVHHFPADREAAKAILAAFPVIQPAAVANRAFLGRAVRYLVEAGVRQFLDVGSGLPTVGSVHEIAQEHAPDTRVVYIDIDPVAVAESRQILNGNQNAIAIRVDARNPQAILDHRQVRSFLDFNAPIAVLLLAVMHFITDDDEAYGMVAGLRAALAPGSYLVMTHGVMEEDRPLDPDNLRATEDVYKRQTTAELRLRTREKFERFFDGTELVPPGLVWVPLWRPAPGDPADFADDPRRSGMLAGVGQLP